MEKPITTRLPEEFLVRIKELARKENLDTSTVIRRLLSRALEEEHFNSVLDKLSKQKISIGKAAELLNLPVWEMINIAKNNNINWPGYNEEELEKDLKIIRKI